MQPDLLVQTVPVVMTSDGAACSNCPVTLSSGTPAVRHLLTVLGSVDALPLLIIPSARASSQAFDTICVCTYNLDYVEPAWWRAEDACRQVIESIQPNVLIVQGLSEPLVANWFQHRVTDSLSTPLVASLPGFSGIVATSVYSDTSTFHRAPERDTANIVAKASSQLAVALAHGRPGDTIVSMKGRWARGTGPDAKDTRGWIGRAVGQCITRMRYTRWNTPYILYARDLSVTGSSEEGYHNPLRYNECERVLSSGPY